MSQVLILLKPIFMQNYLFIYFLLSIYLGLYKGHTYNIIIFLLSTYITTPLHFFTHLFNYSSSLILYLFGRLPN